MADSDETPHAGRNDGVPTASADASQRDDTAAAVREAIASAGVGTEDLSADLAAIDGISDVIVRDGVASVEISLPVPSQTLRDQLAMDVVAAAESVAGVESADIDFQASAADPRERIDMLPGVKNVVAVASGKGGVGKSTIAANLAVALADAGAAVGLLDADVYGPNAPTLLGLDERRPNATSDDEMVPREAYGVRTMSMEFITGEDDPIIWRGPLVDEFIKQLFGDVQWGKLDYLIVDLPPGTGDAHLSLVQHFPVAGAVIVTTPQEVAVDDAARGLVGFARHDTPVLGIVENMAGFECPDCESLHDIFGTGGADDLADQFDVPVLGRIPLEPALGSMDDDGDSGRPPGIDVPLVGRLELPRTYEERTQDNRAPPLACRTDGGAAREQLRITASRIAARLNEAAVTFRK
ncbi:Mrp/NBP35 family ATP-binding protein [Natrinema limicola]|uniref:Iron-sulfur cluster carrier protein n=1 Tax=Natrinema limicola JCM 13563 TaxID=1230457 RepID=M0C2L5_9EURY|nr:Mrp/NBP35 family ATP-binding protein [Natrinema limicola]ELZ17450.1 Cobyrinic acid ac-diamide synthase [Natrinema limicola JCM 13563]